jgi:peptide/nickel transport system permease protein
MKRKFEWKKYSVFLISLICLGILAFIAFIGPILPFIDRELSTVTYIMDENRKPVIPPYGPNEDFPLGTDKKGRDLLSIIVLGARETLLLVIVITALRYALAIPFAFLAHRKVFAADSVLRWLNGFLSYIPTIIIVILVVNLPPLLFAKDRPFWLILVIALSEAARAADMIKLEFDEVSSKEFISGGIAAGTAPFAMFKRYYMPFLYGKILVYMISDLGKVMFLLGQLGFVGIFISQQFVQMPTGMWEFVNTSISWPMLLQDAFIDVRGPIWIPFFAALFMTFSIFTFNLLSQGIKHIFARKIRYL